MMRIIRFIAFIALSLPVCGWRVAAGFEVDGLEYTVLSAVSVSVSGADKAKTGAVVIPAEVTDGSATYSVVSVDERAFEDCSAITSVTIPHSVTSVGNDAFSFCVSLRDVVFADSSEPIAMGYIPNLNAGVFADSPVAKVYIGRDLSYNTRRGHSPFSGSARLAEVVIGPAVTKIGERLFSGCTSLSSISTAAVMPPAVGVSAFDGVDKDVCVVSVPHGAVTAYALSVGWSEFATITDGSQSSVASSVADCLFRVTTRGGRLSLESLPEGAEIRLYRADGALVRAVCGEGPEYEAAIPSGIYLLVIETDASSTVMKVCV